METQAYAASATRKLHMHAVELFDVRSCTLRSFGYSSQNQGWNPRAIKPGAGGAS